MISLCISTYMSLFDYVYIHMSVCIVYMVASTISVNDW